MLRNGLIAGAIILTAIFIAQGDQLEFLPKQMQTASYQTRTSLSKFASGLVPAWVSNTKDKRDDVFDRTEEQMQSPPSE